MGNVKLEWDGEKIKQSVKYDDIQITPKDIINSIDHARGELDKIKGQKKQLQENLINIEEDIKSVNSFILDRLKFEDKCLELCLNKLKKIIAEITPELIGKADSEGQAIINKAPDSYTEQQIINQKYVIFQKMLATYPKIAEKIPNRLIRDNLYENPIFENPFKN